MDLSPGQTEQATIAEACAEGAFDRPGLGRAADLMQEGSAKYQERGHLIMSWLAATQTQRQASFARYAAAFDYADRTLLTKSMRERWPPAFDIVDAERTRTRATVEQLNSVQIGKVGTALTQFSQAVGKALP